MPKFNSVERASKGMLLAAFFASWREIVDQECFRENNEGLNTDDMFDKYQRGELDGTDVLLAVRECMKEDTEESKDKENFFQDLLIAVNEIEARGGKLVREPKEEGGFTPGGRVLSKRQNAGVQGKGGHGTGSAKGGKGGGGGK